MITVRTSEGLDGDAGAHLAHERREHQVIAVGQERLGLWLSLDGGKDEMRVERITVDGKTYEMR